MQNILYQKTVLAFSFMSLFLLIGCCDCYFSDPHGQAVDSSQNEARSEISTVAIMAPEA